MSSLSGFRAVAALGGCFLLGAVAAAQPLLRLPAPASFVNWETPHGGSPLTMTPDGTRLLAVNTADNRLEVFTLSGGAPVWTASIPVGLDPVSVRARSNTEAWVVNHVSDSVSIVNLTTLAVTTTLKVQDEPFDVVFAGAGAAQKAYVSCAQTKTVLEFQAANPSLTPTAIAITGEQPRAMAVSADGSRVYVAIFESGNHSTVIGGGGQTSGANTLAFPPNVVNVAGGPYGGVNPPPNTGGAGGSFFPAIAPQNQSPAPPAVSLIVKKNGAGLWMDDNGGNWSNFVSGPQATQSGRPVGWDLYDNDVAIIDTASRAVTYATGLMNICMNLAVNPATGAVAVVGTDGTNQVRFEPNVKGKFLRVELASFDPASPANPAAIADLNPHLTYAVSTVVQTERDKSLGDPRAIVFASSGALAYVSGMGSNSVVAVTPGGGRAGPNDVISVGKGPTGLALDEARARLYVLNKFDGSISTVSTATRAVVYTSSFFDPTPAIIKTGRTHLYDTHKNSGLGQIACASCHLDSKIDRLAWDLGDPTGTPITVTAPTRNLGQNLLGLNTGFQPYHPMKGPMTTQTLQDIIGKEPHHWRGDRLGLEEFAGAFIGLQGDDITLTATEMQEFEDFLATVTFPPNPYRNMDNTLPTGLPLPGHFTTGRFTAAGQPLGLNNRGNAQAGLAVYIDTNVRIDRQALACVTCHTLPTGAGTDMKMTGPVTLPYIPIAPGPNGEHHLSLVSVDGTTNVTMKVPQLRNMYKKVGFNTTQTTNTAGFGLLHDGSIDSIERFVSEPVFNVTGDQMVADLTAFMLAFSGSDLPQGATNSLLNPPGPASKDTHAAVGVQTTAAAVTDLSLIASMAALADSGKVGLVAQGLVAGKQRGYAYLGGGSWQSDKRAEVLTTAALEALAGAASPITFTVVPKGTETRIGIDRDLDGYFDRDELTVCANPADPASHPGRGGKSGDWNGDILVSVQDIFDFLADWFSANADFNGSGTTTVQDIFDFLAAWFIRC